MTVLGGTYDRLLLSSIVDTPTPFLLQGKDTRVFGGRGRTFESCRAHGLTKPFSRAEMPKSAPFIPRTLPPLPLERQTSRAQREQEAKEYWTR
jgi:hypothetical protein